MAQVGIAQIQSLFSITAAGQAAKASSLPVTYATEHMGQQTMANSLSVVQASTHQFLSKIVDTGGTNVGTVKAASTAAATTDTALVVSMAGANSATKIGDGTNNATIKAASTAPAAADPALVVSLSPNSLVSTAGGATYIKVHSATSNNATSVKASAGQVYGWFFFNTNTTTTKYVKLYNKASAPAPATDNAVLAITIAVPALGGTNVFWGSGVVFATGIAYAIVGGVSETDNTSVTVNEVMGWLLYK